jgi:predicted Zn-dependent protease
MNSGKRNKKDLKFFPWMILAILIIAIFPLAYAQTPEDVVFKALEDELSRTVQQLWIGNMERPFYVGYVLTEFQDFELDGCFGSISRKEDSKKRYFSVDLRVGDYAFDNTNFIGDFYGLYQQPVEVSLEDSYAALRQDIWLATDQAYKKALEKLAQKKAYVQTKAITDLPEDFSKERPYTEIEPKVDLMIDKRYWGKGVEELSAVFKDFPLINDSEVKFKAVAINRYFLNSEGFKNRKGDFIVLLEVSASTQAEDGQNVYNFESFYAQDLKDFPKKEELAEKIKELARKTLDLSRAEQLPDYVGPVIFTGQASAEFFRQLLAANVSSPRTPLLADERFADMVQKSKLPGKLYRRILPSFFDVVDDPTISIWNGTPLIGGYKVDDEGVLAQKVSLVEKGKLANLLMSRIPIKKVKQSNGHARGSVFIPITGRPANLIVIPDEKTAFQNLKSKLLEYCKDMGLEYGIIVTKLRDKNFRLETDPNTDLASAQLKAELCFPIEAYKIYVKDGKEELIRGVEFEGTTVRALKDIAEAGDDAYVYNFLLGHNFELPTSILTPSILVEELELKKTESKPSKPPILKSPYTEK